MKLKINQYPKQGFGGKAGKFYLLNEFGTIYDIQDYYEKIDKKMVKMVEYGNHTIYGDDIDEIIEKFDIELNIKIEKW